MRQKLIEVRREIVRFTYIVGDFDTTQSVTDKPSRQKISKDLVEWNSIINQLDLNDNYRIPVVQLLSHVWLFSSPWTEACQASLFFTISQRLFKLMSIESVMPSNHFILSSPSPPAFNLSQHQSFLMSQLFPSSGQSIGASASYLPMNIQDWSPLGWTGLSSLQSNGLLRVFSNTTFKSTSSSALSFLYSPTLTSIHDYWKKHSFD